MILGQRLQLPYSTSPNLVEGEIKDSNRVKRFNFRIIAAKLKFLLNDGKVFIDGELRLSRSYFGGAFMESGFDRIGFYNYRFGKERELRQLLFNQTLQTRGICLSNRGLHALCHPIEEQLREYLATWEGTLLGKPKLVEDDAEAA